MTVTVVSGRTQQDTFPIGSIISWHKTTGLPDGWLVCDGSLQPIATYPALYQVITSGGVVFPFGVNSGSSFRIPLLTGRFMVTPTTTTPPAGTNSNVGVVPTPSGHTHNYAVSHTIGSSDAASHSPHNVGAGSWVNSSGGGHNLQTNIGALSATVNAGAAGNLNTAFGSHLHNQNQGNQTTGGHSHNHNFTDSFDNAIAGGSLHVHNFSITASTNADWTSTPLVKNAPCVFLILASVSEPRERQ